jgi:hypothetical protein
MNTPNTTTKDYGEHTVSELVTMINTEYAAIIETDRSNLQRAIGIGEKLLDLKPRVAKHGEWQLWLKNHCPKISIETANLYMRLADNLDKLEKEAAAKSVRLTDLTITEARALLAKPKPDTNGKKKGGSGSGDKGGVEPGNEPDADNEEEVGKEWLRALAVDDLITWLKEVHDTDYLLELSEALSKVLPAKVDPLAIPPALQRTAPGSQATMQPIAPNASSGVGSMRRA